MLVSIITPSYNQAAFLEQTIVSVLNQQDAEIEYCIVDGGSDDNSVGIIRQYADNLAWWVSEPDAGQADAINKGLRRARGEIVAWLNSDDLYLPGAVSDAAAIFEANPHVNLVFGDAVTINAGGEPLHRLQFGDWGLNELMSFSIICQPAVFMRRTALVRAGFLDPSYHYLLDHQLWIRLARLGPIQHVAKTWAAARHHPQAKNVAHAAAFGEEALRILNWMRSQDDLAPVVESRHRQIEAGAYRLQARYLLDGGFPAPALAAYFRALRRSPAFALQHWHRMLYAVLSLVGGRNLASYYYRTQSRPQIELPTYAGCAAKTSATEREDTSSEI